MNVLHLLNLVALDDFVKKYQTQSSRLKPKKTDPTVNLIADLIVNLFVDAAISTGRSLNIKIKIASTCK
jgi:hypothetical protein